MGKALCNAINEQFEFTVASKEVYGGFRSSYEKLVLPRETAPGGNDLFLYVDYRIETLVISQFLEADIQPSLRKFRKLAMIVTDYPEEVSEKFWDACPDLFPDLTTLVFLRTVNGFGTYRTECEYEWKFLRIPLEYGNPIELPTSLEDWDVRRSVAIEFGNLRFMCAEAQQWKTKFLEYMEPRKQWSGIAVDVCVEARRAEDDRSWALEYWVEDGRPADDDSDGGWHWHREPVIIKEEMLTECESQSVYKL